MTIQSIYETADREWQFMRIGERKRWARDLQAFRHYIAAMTCRGMAFISSCSGKSYGQLVAERENWLCLWVPSQSVG